MSISLSVRRANPGNAKPLIGLYGEGKVGKTTSAGLLARGFVGPEGRIIMVETERGRGEAAAKKVPGGFDVIPLEDDYSAQRYGAAIRLAEKERADALIIDSASHEWESVGGVLDQAEKRRAGGAKGVLVWQQPKIDHARHFMLPLLNTSIPLVIVNMRAKYPMEETIVNNKKEWVRSKELQPIQSDGILFELFFCAWLDHEHKVHVWGTNDDTLRDVIREGQPITLETGRALRAWSAGSAPTTEPPRAAAQPAGPTSDPGPAGAPSDQGGLPLDQPAGQPRSLKQVYDAVMAKLGRVDTAGAYYAWLDEADTKRLIEALKDPKRAESHGALQAAMKAAQVRAGLVQEEEQL